MRLFLKSIRRNSKLKLTSVLWPVLWLNEQEADNFSLSGKHAEAELIEVSDRLSGLAAQNSALAGARRKLESDNEQLRSDLEEALLDAKNADERAKKAVIDVSI